MKKLTLLLAIAVSALFGNATLHAAGPITWAQSYGVGAYLNSGKHADSQFYGSGDDYPVGIAKMPDGGVVVAGQLSFPKDARDSVPTYTTGVVRFGPDGTILWQRVLSLPQTTGMPPTFYRAPVTVSQVVADPQGNIFLAVSKGTPGTGVQVASVVKFSAAGALLWENGIKGAATKEGDPPQTTVYGVPPFNTMSLTPDGGVLVGSSQYIRNNYYTVPIIAKFNSDGSVGMFATFDYNQTFTSGKEGYAIQYLGTSAVAASKDGSKYVALLQYPVAASVNPSSRGLTAVITDTAGNIIAVRTFAPTDGRQEMPISIIATSDGGFATLSWIAGDFPANGGFCLRRFNSDLSVETFEKVVKNATSSDRISGMSLAEATDGTLVVGGHTNNGFEDAMIMKFNASGTPEFCSLLGGPRQEGGPSKQYAPDTGAYIAVMPDGGYAFTAATLSYGTDSQLNYTDWWVVKTDASRKVRGFTDTMTEKVLSAFAVTDTTRPPDNTRYFYRISPDAVGPVVTDLPRLNVSDPATFEVPNQPELLIQASSPKIVSGTGAEAIVGQHFSYQVLAGFFSSGKALTYSASGLPGNFVIDSKTGLISGLAQPGSETATPIPVTLQVSDGTDAATATLSLIITDGVPALTVTRYDGNDPANPVLEFALAYAGQNAGRSVDIQASTNGGGTWTNLPTAVDGRMSYELAQKRYVLNTTNYPAQNSVTFRARVRTYGRSDAMSNVVGPLNLSSATQRAARTAFRVIRNGVRADFDFRTTEVSPAPGLAVRVQTSRTPGDEASWSDLASSFGNISAMTAAADGIHYSLATNQVPPDRGIYFRAVASASGFVDSLSNVIGPYRMTGDAPPTVTITSPGGGSGQDVNSPVIISLDSSGSAHFKVSASAQSQRQIAALTILFDGNAIGDFGGGATTGSVDYTTNVIGMHVIEALAIDDLGAIGRGSSAPTYVKVVPARATVRAERAGDSAAAAAGTGQVFNAVADGNWKDANTWTNETTGAHGVPGPGDFAIVKSRTVIIDSNVGDVEVGALMINGGHINTPPLGNGTLKVDRKLTIASGGMDRIHLQIPSTCQVDMVNEADFPCFCVVSNTGTWNIRGTGGLIGLYSFVNAGNASFKLPLIKPGVDPLSIPPTRLLVTGSYQIDGGIVSNPGLPGLVGIAAGSTGNGGFISRGNGTLISQDGGSLINQDGASLINQDGASLINQDGASLINQDGASIISTDGASQHGGYGGNIMIGNTGNTSTQSATRRAASTASGVVLNGGELDLTGTAVTGSITINNGILRGTGIVAGDLTNNGGYISPGHSPGVMAVTGNFSQSSSGTLIMEAAGGAAGQFDRMEIGGAASFAGNLNVHLLNGYIPLQGETFNLIGYRSAAGALTASSNAAVTANANGLLVTINPNAAQPSTARLLNISTRLSVQTGENVLISGFIVTGPVGSTKKIMIRGLGPSLANQGVPNTLSDPLLELHKGDGSLVTSNDDWQQGDTSQIPTGFGPSNAKESVIVATLTVGSAGYSSYTAVMKGAHDEKGVGLAEVYDLEGSSQAQLANISTRGIVQTGDDVMIGGVIVGGGDPSKVLVRAIGPSLKAAGVNGALDDTTLELHDAQGATVANDDWRESQEKEVTATTIPPVSERESAIVQTLVPGNYTAIVRGKNGATGVGLVEAYNLQ